MRFFHPQIQLARESVPNKPDAFYLHVVTYCPRTCFRAFGHFVDDSELDKGKYKVKVRLLEDPEMPNLMYITPVAHTIPLGSIDFPGGEGEVDVEVIGQVPDPSGVRTRSGGPAQKTKTGYRKHRHSRYQNKTKRMGRIGIIRFAMLVLYGIALKPCFAQFEALRPEHQSLLKSLDKTRSGVDSLVEWAYDARFSAQEQAYANAAFVQANRIGYPAGAATALVKLGHIALDAAIYTEADRCYHQALHLRDSLKLVSGVASCYNNLSLVKKKQGDYPMAINLLQQGLEVAQDTHRIAIALHNNLGILLSATSRCEEAFRQFEESLKLAESFREKADMASARLNMGSVLQDCQGQYDQALTLLEQCRNDLQALKRPDLLAKCYLLLGNNAYFKGSMPRL
jgi:Tetratricopeptide repeat